MIKKIFRSKVFLTGLGILAIGCGPLLLYALYEFITGAKGGNPVGLGLLLAVSFWPGVILLVAGIILGLLNKDKAV
ncbi:MAG: hypothetical protein NTX59_11515 [Elusimicrobia bacterium]|nr:hypothetical protein [Elusimicrobiota bacterium]